MKTLKEHLLELLHIHMDCVGGKADERFLNKISEVEEQSRQAAVTPALPLPEHFDAEDDVQSEGWKFRRRVKHRFRNTDSGGAGEMTKRERILLWICSSEHVIQSGGNAG